MNSLLFSLLDSVKNETAATSEPTVNDDSSKGFSFGSIWFNSSSGKLYIAINVTQGAAIWVPVNGENYKGSWNASTNIPLLADGVGTVGDNYLVSVAGSQNLGSGTIVFVLGDLIIYDGTIWKKGGISYTPENVANKSTDGTMAANSATLYPSQSAVVTYASAKVADSISDGVTEVAPSQNAVFDALALKQNTSEKDATGGYTGLTLFKINFKNAANTFTSFFTNANTAARTYTFQDRDGTILDSTDLSTLNANSTGSGGLVRATSPALVTPALGTPASGVLTNCTGYTSVNLPTGTCLKVVSTSKTDTASTTSSTYAAITGLSATITPVNSSSKILVRVILSVGGSALTKANFQLFRDTTQIGGGSAPGVRISDSAVLVSSGSTTINSFPIEFLDSPVTGSAVVYSVKWSSPDNGSTMYLNRAFTDTSSALISRTISTITLQEFKG